MAEDLKNKEGTVSFFNLDFQTDGRTERRTTDWTLTNLTSGCPRGPFLLPPFLGPSATVRVRPRRGPPQPARPRPRAGMQMDQLPLFLSHLGSKENIVNSRIWWVAPAILSFSHSLADN